MVNNSVDPNQSQTACTRLETDPFSGYGRVPINATKCHQPKSLNFQFDPSQSQTNSNSVVPIALLLGNRLFERAIVPHLQGDS